jgi:predicted phosphodiesterase
VRVFTVSDIHIDYDENRRWLHNLSQSDYQDDVLILAGDITDVVLLFIEGFEALKRRFLEVLYVPGNHDLWVHRNGGNNSLDHFFLIRKIADDYGIRMEPVHFDSLSIVPLFGWYDYSFGRPSKAILNAWVDYVACRWPLAFDELAITEYFVTLNEAHLNADNQTVISFSHFLPRIDLMPATIPADKRILYPVLGTTLLEQQLRQLKSDTHIYGHSHVNRYLAKDDVLYINNAFGYPHESRARKELLCVA